MALSVASTVAGAALLAAVAAGARNSVTFVAGPSRAGSCRRDFPPAVLLQGGARPPPMPGLATGIATIAGLAVAGLSRRGRFRRAGRRSEVQPPEPRAETPKTEQDWAVALALARQETRFVAELAKKDIEQAVAKKDLELALAKRDKELAKELAKRDKELAKRDVELARAMKDLDYAKADLLRAKGLLTSRGIVESMAQSAWVECGRKVQNFNFAQAAALVSQDPQAGYWTEKLSNFTNACFPDRPVEDGLLALFREVSRDIHGYPWSGQAVKVLQCLSLPSLCMVRRIAQLYNLETDEVDR